MDEVIGELKLQMKDGSVVDAILYCHQETVNIAGTNYYLLKKDTPADAAGTTLSASTASVARVVWGRFVFPLTNIVRILSATIYATYRAYTGGGTVNAEIDILIRRSNGTVRTTIATGVSKSSNLPTSWATLTGANYSFAEYTVVDETDYLEIDYIANVTVKKAGQYAYLRIDDQTLAPANQTRSQEWAFSAKPVVVTHDATNITQNSARLNGEVTAINDTSIVERGFEWGFSSGNYTYSWTETGNFGTGTFYYDLSNIPTGARIYFRAKAKNSTGNWGYGSEKYFDTLLPPPAMGWLSGWQYRKVHAITPASGAGTNYPIRIKVYYGSGTDNGENVYLNGKCRSDFADIRFTNSDGTTILNYWMENKVDGDYASFWVEIPQDLSNNSAIIYIYYGNSEATRADNPHCLDIFSLREHQIYSAYYPNITFQKPTETVLRMDSYSAGISSFGESYLFITILKSYLHNKKVRIYWNGYFSYSYSRAIGSVAVLDTELRRSQTLTINSIHNIFPYIELLTYTTISGQTGWMGWRTDTSATIDLSDFTNDYVTLLIKLTDGWTGQTVMIDVDYLQILDENNNVLHEYHFTGSVIMEVTGTYEDYGLCRKYVSPEPTHGAWGGEETPIPAPVVVAHNATNITDRSARLNGEVTAINDTSIVERGFEWGFEPGNYAYSWTETGNFGTGTFYYDLSNLPPNTRIYFRAKAKNSNGYWSCSSEKYFDTLPTMLVPMTLVKRYVVISSTSISTTSGTLVDDSEAIITFTLDSPKTVLAIYQAHGTSSLIHGAQHAINIDGVDVANSWDSRPFSMSVVRNMVFWVGTLSAGEHTIKGRFASNSPGDSVSITNRVLIVAIFNGSGYYYVDDATTITTTSGTFINDIYAKAIFAPSENCKALILYNITNLFGTEHIAGKKAAININGVDYAQAEKSPAYDNYWNSVFTAYALALQPQPTYVQGRFASNSGGNATSIDRRQFAVLLFDNSTLLDVVTTIAQTSTTSNALVDDPYALINRTITDNRELLVIAVGTKRHNTTSSGYGERYGISLNDIDRISSRSGGADASCANSAATAYMRLLAAGEHTIKGRFSNNYGSETAVIDARIIIALWFVAPAPPPPFMSTMTLRNKYIVTSTTQVITNSDTLVDDSEAIITFTLDSPKTVLAIYQANNHVGAPSPPSGVQHAINIDGVDVANSWDAGNDDSLPVRNMVFWVGTLSAGEHTIKGRFASNSPGDSVSITNRVLIVAIFNGSGYYYVDDATTITTTSGTFVDDVYAQIDFTPLTSCKALILYNITNRYSADNYRGKKAAININGVDYAQAEKSKFLHDLSNSIFTCYALRLCPEETYVKGRFASNSGGNATSIDRRQFAVLLFDDSTLLDIVHVVAQTSTTSNALVDDPYALINRTITDNRELLVIAVGTKRDGTSSSVYGERYGISLNDIDRISSRGCGGGAIRANSAATAYMQLLSAGEHTIKGRFSNNYGSETAVIDARIIIALWFTPVVPPTLEMMVANTFPMYYLTSPPTANELITKVSGATVTKTDNTFPRYLIKAGKAQELRSKWS